MYKGHNFCDFLLTFLYTKLVLKRVYSKREEFAPMGSKFFPFRVDPILREGETILTVASFERVSLPLILFFFIYFIHFFIFFYLFIFFFYFFFFFFFFFFFYIFLHFKFYP